MRHKVIKEYGCAFPDPVQAVESVETTVHVHPQHVRRGLERRVYVCLLERLAPVPGLHRARTGIALPNPVSITFHALPGFRLAGTFHEADRKFGRYRAVAWYERDL